LFFELLERNSHTHNNLNAIRVLSVETKMRRGIVYPTPQWVKEKNEDFYISPETPILTSSNRRKEAEHLKNWLQQEYGLELRITEASGGGRGIIIRDLNDAFLDEFRREKGGEIDDEILRAEGYLLDVNSNRVLVAGVDGAGTFYGIQSLKQLIIKDGNRLRVKGMEIHDLPHKRIRGVHFYMPGRDRIPFFKRLLKVLAFLKYNTIFLEVGAGMRYDRHPEINEKWEEFTEKAMRFEGGLVPGGSGPTSQPFPKNSTHTELGGGSFLKKEEVKELIDLAEKLHFEVIPEVPSLSHSYYLVYPHPEIAERRDDPYPDTYCPSNPASYELLFDVMEEVIEVFQPKIVHIGHDEVYSYGICPRCKGKPGDDLLAGDIIKIHNFLAERGIRTAMWGDKLMNIIVGGRDYGGRRIKRPEYVMEETYPAVDKIPKDILILDWYWSIDPHSEDYFASKGFEEIFGNFHNTFKNWETRGSKNHVLGAEASTWCDISEYAFGHNGYIFNILLAAEMLWWQNYADYKRGEAVRRVAALQPYIRDVLGNRRSPSMSDLPKEYLFVQLEETCNIHAPFFDSLPKEGINLRDIPFRLSTCQSEKGHNAVQVDMKSPKAFITIEQEVNSLLFLHTCYSERPFRYTYSFANPLGRSPENLLGFYKIIYSNEAQEVVELRHGDNIARWDLHYGEDDTARCYWADPIWGSRDEKGKVVTLYCYEWTNPHPNKKLRGVELILNRDSHNDPDEKIILLAITGIRLPKKY